MIRVRDRLVPDLMEQIANKVWNPTRYQVRSWIGAQVCEQIDAQVRVEIRNKIEDDSPEPL